MPAGVWIPYDLLRRLSTAVAFAATIVIATGATWRVERDGTGDFTTIQPAVDSAAPGDTIKIGPGNYTETTIFPYDNEIEQGETYVGIQVDDLTLIGCHRDSVVVGPALPDFSGFRPKGIMARLDHITNISIQQLTIQNVYEGIRGHGETTIESIRAVSCGTAIHGAPGSNLAVSGLQTVGSTVSGISFFRCEPSVLRDSTFQDSLAVSIHSNQSSGIVVEDCTVSGGGRVQFDQASSGTLRRCRVESAVGPAISAVLSSEIFLFDCHLSGTEGNSIFASGYSCVSGTGNTLAAYGDVTLTLFSDATLELERNDIVLAPNDYTVLLQGYTGSPTTVVVNLRNNYWSGASADSVASEIWDGNDDLSINGVVEYLPMRNRSIPTKGTSVGGLKSRY